MELGQQPEQGGQGGPERDPGATQATPVMPPAATDADPSRRGLRHNRGAQALTAVGAVGLA